MSQDRVELRAGLDSVAEGRASFGERAKIEHALIGVLRERGATGVADLLDAVPGYAFTATATSVPGESRFVGQGSHAKVVVTCFVSAASLSVNVEREEPRSDPDEPDPRHRAFYGIWESLLGLSDQEVGGLEVSERAVYLVALLEAEVMNGGLGQYLTNTGGTHLEATLETLAEIGAVETAAILRDASDLGRRFPDPAAAWEADPAGFERLDERYAATGEDLAGLTADRFEL